MDIIFHAHHAVISPRMRQRAERAVRKLARRMPRPVDAVVRFEQDGPTRRVELLLHGARHRDLVAEGRHRYFGPALAEALDGLQRQVTRVKRTPKARRRTGVRAPT